MSLTKGDLHAIDSIVTKRVTERTDGLARMVAKGFEQTPTVEDFHGLETKMTDGFEGLGRQVAGLHQTVSVVHDSILQDYGERIRVLEEAVGLRKR